ncbi:hypothetical protein R6Q57_005707 [Mikania cordata]
MGITPSSENVVLLSALTFQASGSQHYQTLSCHSVPFETAFLSLGKETDSYDWSDQVQELEMTLSHAFMAEVDEKSNEVREKRGKGLGYKECEPPFNHNYSSMPRINTSVDDLVLQSDRAFELPTEPVSLIVDPMFVSDDSEICADSLSDAGLRDKDEEKVLGGAQNDIDSSPLKQVNRAHSTITKEASSKLNPNCEPYVPTESLEQAPTSTSPSQGDCDVKPFDPKYFNGKVCCFACGRPGHITRHCLYRPTEFFYGKNQKVTPKAKPTSRPLRTDQSSKPRVKP